MTSATSRGVALVGLDDVMGAAIVLIALAA